MVAHGSMGDSDPRRAGIQRINVENLHGQYTYRLEPPPELDSDLSRAMILYGDNGSGKTTILDVLFHLLSPGKNSGHRTALGQIPLGRFDVEFRDGRRVWMKRDGDNLIGEYQICVEDSRGAKTSAVWKPDSPPTGDTLEQARRFYALERPRQHRKSMDAIDTYAAALAEIVPETIYYLDDNRRLQSDSLPDDEEDEGFYIMSSREHRRVSRYVLQTGGKIHDDDLPIDPRTVALIKSFDRANRWISQRLIDASTIGGRSTNAIYVDVAKRIATSSESDDPGVGTPAEEIQERLLRLDERAEAVSSLGLIPPSPTIELYALLRDVQEDRLRPVLSVIVPFADALEARIDALEEIREVLATFLNEANSFLDGGKHVNYSSDRGLEIYTQDGTPLRADLLSSGERQLLLLLTSTLHARSKAMLYLIDEPELSLNMKWQRRLVGSLAACTRGSGSAFVMASHSFELMAAARERVVELVPF